MKKLEFTHIEISKKAFKLDEDFNKNMCEGARQEKIARAAPELLEALEALLHSEWQDDEGHPRLTQARDKARAAIAKAKE